MATKSTQLLRAADLRVHVRGGPNDDGRGDGPLVILLHGYGAPGDDLLGLYEVLGMPRSFRFAFPEAPLGLDFGGRAWR